MLELFYLKCWVGLVGAIAVVNALKTFVDNAYPRKRLYTLSPKEAGALFARMYGAWTLLAGAIRIAFAFSLPTPSFQSSSEWLPPFLAPYVPLLTCFMLWVLSLTLTSRRRGEEGLGARLMRVLCLLTFFSFGLAFFHFAVEVFITKTAPLGFATVSPLLISGGSMLWMSPILLHFLAQ